MGKEEKKPSSDGSKNSIERVKSGITGLDQMIEGGLEKNNSIVVRGASGVGKTIFALQYIYAGITKYDEPGVYISFNESKEAILKQATIFGWDFEELEEKKKFTFARYEPHEVKDIIASGGGSIRDMIESNKTKRLVIDSLSAYMLLFENEYEANRSVLGLFEMLRSLNCTVLVTSDEPITPNSGPPGKTAFLTDGIIDIYMIRKGTKILRIIEIAKMRDTSHATGLYKFEITKKGIEVKGDDPIAID